MPMTDLAPAGPVRQGADPGRGAPLPRCDEAVSVDGPVKGKADATRRILCPTDGSDRAGRTIALAVALADAFGATLTICAFNVLVGPADSPAFRIWTEDKARKVVPDAVTTAQRFGQAAPETVLMSSREAPAGIVHHAETAGIDCIVLGTGD